jgi:hypothetical protein
MTAMTIKKALAVAASVTALSVLLFGGIAGTAAASSADSNSTSGEQFDTHLVIGNTNWDFHILPLPL